MNKSKRTRTYPYWSPVPNNPRDNQNHIEKGEKKKEEDFNRDNMLFDNTLQRISSYGRRSINNQQQKNDLKEKVSFQPVLQLERNYLRSSAVKHIKTDRSILMMPTLEISLMQHSILHISSGLSFSMMNTVEPYKKVPYS